MSSGTTDQPSQIICIGEVLVDLVPDAASGAYMAKLGGAPANVAIIASALGVPAALISRVGADWLGGLIIRDLREKNVRTDFVRESASNTGIAVVAPVDAGPPDFLMYRNGTADSAIRLSLQEKAAVADARIVHVSSLLPTTSVGRDAALSAVSTARQNGSLVSYDVNLRPTGWAAPELMVASAHEMIEAADIVKVTEDELVELDVTVTSKSAGALLWLVTDGHRGARLVSSRWEVTQPAPVVPVVDTTGAGDATLAALLVSVLASPEPLTRLGEQAAAAFLELSVRTGSWVVQHAGATDQLPGKES